MTLNNTESPNSDRLAEIERQLTLTQIRFMTARLETETDKEAAQVIGIDPNTVKNWNRTPAKALIEEGLRLMVHDGVVTAREILRRNLAKAAAVKVSGLDSDNEKIRQDAATEIIDRAGDVGKPSQKVDQNNSGEVKVVVEYADLYGEAT